MRYGLNDHMPQKEVETTLQQINLFTEDSSYYKTTTTNFPQLSEKEEKEKAQLIQFGLRCIAPKDQDQYFQEVANRYLKNLSKSEPLPQIKKEFNKSNLPKRRNSQ